MKSSSTYTKRCSYDLPQFNLQLLHWLAWLNSLRPHRSLQMHTPLDILTRHLGPKCRMYWPNTRA